MMQTLGGRAATVRCVTSAVDTLSIQSPITCASATLAVGARQVERVTTQVANTVVDGQATVETVVLVVPLGISSANHARKNTPRSMGAKQAKQDLL